MLEREYTAENPVEEVTPDACVELIFNFGAPYILLSEGLPDREMPNAILVGLLRKPLRFRADGTVKLVSIRFHAWGALPLLALQPVTAATPLLAFGDEWKALSARIGARIDAGDYDAAVAAVEQFLLDRLSPAPRERTSIEAAARLLHDRKGQVGIEHLAERSNVSTRQLQRRFQQATGVSPKYLARAIRFEEIRKRLMFDPDASLTDLAHEFGYVDQAHFIRDFREFCDRTPGEFADEMRALQAAFQDRDNVVFLQFPASAAR
jgi:AraC-like DNA-binding protein